MIMSTTKRKIEYCWLLLLRVVKMSSGAEQPPPQHVANPNPPLEWISMAQSWLTSNFSEAGAPSMAQFEDWFETVAASLPEEVMSTPSTQLYQMLMATAQVKQEQGGVKSGAKHAKFQRTDQWQPVYYWLESLDKEEVVRSEDIAEWLEKNPGIKEALSAKHSRYHLMHYIKKCHFKILKRRDIKKGLLRTDRAASAKIRPKELPTRELVQYSSAHLTTKVPKSDDLYLAKRNEAAQKFEILVEFEKRLMAQFPNSGV